MRPLTRPVRSWAGWRRCLGTASPELLHRARCRHSTNGPEVGPRGHANQCAQKMDNDTYPVAKRKRPSELGKEYPAQPLMRHCDELAASCSVWAARNRPAPSDDRGQHEEPVRHSQLVADSNAAEAIPAASAPVRRTGSCGNAHSQMVVQKRPDPDHSQIVAEHSQEVADRTNIEV